MTFRYLCKNIQQKILIGGCRPSIIETTFRFIRGRGGSRKKPLSNAEFQEFLAVEDDNEVDLADLAGNPEKSQLVDFIANVNLKDPETRRELKRLEKHDRHRLKRTIIKKKLFKKKPELNVLTWQAKEQMRYLHQENPEEWNVDRLVETFPVSKNGVSDILKSTYVPRNEAEIRKHDNKAIKNTETIKQNVENGDIELDDQEMEKLREKLAKVGNAAGIKSLPLTKIVTRQTIAAHSKLLRPSKKIGPFQSMLMYYDKMTSGAEIQQEQYVLLPEAKYAEEVEENNIVTKKQNGILSESNLFSPREEGTKSQMTSDVTKKSNNPNDYISQKGQVSVKRVDEYNRTVLDMNKHHKMRNISTIKESTWRERNKLDHSLKWKKKQKVFDHNLSNEDSISDYQSYHQSSEENQSFRYENSNAKFDKHGIETNTATKINSSKIKALQNENLGAVDTNSKIKKWNSEPEVYTPDKFGKVVTKKIPYAELEDNSYSRSVTTRRRKRSFYQKENIVYDQHGEFLYKIP